MKGRFFRAGVLDEARRTIIGPRFSDLYRGIPALRPAGQAGNAFAL
jgi:hypothetical protein